MLDFIILQAEAGQGENRWSFWIMMLLICGVFYFFMIRPQSKKQKELQKQREEMKKGDKVVTAGGIHGTIREVEETTFLIEIAKETVIKVDKSSVFSLATPVETREKTPTNIEKK